MPAIHLEPLDVDIDLLPDEVLIEAAWRLGYRWPTTCWAQAECMLCRVRVVAGEDAVDPAGAEEVAALRTRLPSSARGPDVRLACRLTVNAAGATVRKAGVAGPIRHPR